MIVTFDNTGTVHKFEELLADLESRDEVTAIMVLACDENDFQKSKLDPILTKCTTPVFGGIFPQIIYQAEAFLKGTLVIGLTVPVHLSTIPFLSSPDVDYEMLLEENIPMDISAKTMFVFVDGFGKRISSLIDGLFNVFGLETNYIGGGAGSLSFNQKPILFSNDGLLQDAAILALTQHESGIGVSHGWNTIGGPFRVSKSEHNKIISLDWKPAFDVYREIVEKHSGEKFTSDNFFDIAKAYPFGLAKLEGEKIVRDPISVSEDGSLTCVGEVPQDIFVHILNGDTESLVTAAGDALGYSLENRGDRGENDFVFVIDCVSRVLFLQDDFKLELKALSTTQLPLIGALTLGEIANNGQAYLEFYNKTSVVGLLGT